MELKKQKLALSQSLIKSVVFNNVDVSYRIKGKKKISLWVSLILRKELKSIGLISYNLCSDEFLLNINKTYLKHGTYTDIITFDLSDAEYISGDIYISIDRVKENAFLLAVPFQEELLRVIGHGILHLCGYNDKTINEKRIMRKKENHYLSLLV